MIETNDLRKQVMQATRENGASSLLLRNAIGRKLGLNIADAECLSLLSMQGVATPKELAQYTGLTTGSTTAMLDRLERAGFVSRKPNPNDRRGVLVEINATYADVVRPFVMDLQRAQMELLGRYTDDQLIAIADFLSRFSTNVSDHAQRIK